MARRLIIMAALAATLAAACSPASEPAASSPTSTGAGDAASTTTPTPSTSSVPITAPPATTAAPEPAAPTGTWRPSILADGEAVIGFAELDGVAVMVTQTTGLLRSYARYGTTWEPLQPDPAIAVRLSFDDVTWTSVASDGARITVAGAGRAEGAKRTELRPVFATTDDGVDFIASTPPGATIGYPHDITTDGGLWVAAGSATPPKARWGPGLAWPQSNVCGNFASLGSWNGVHWRSKDAPEAMDPAWPSRPTRITLSSGTIVYGVMELVADDLIEYSVPGFGVIATYQPSDDSGIVFCD